MNTLLPTRELTVKQDCAVLIYNTIYKGTSFLQHKQHMCVFDPCPSGFIFRKKKTEALCVKHVPPVHKYISRLNNKDDVTVQISDLAVDRHKGSLITKIQPSLTDVPEANKQTSRQRII